MTEEVKCLLDESKAERSKADSLSEKIESKIEGKARV